MTRVVIIPSAFHPSLGGVEEIGKNLGTTLQEHGYQVTIAVHQWPKELPKIETLFGLPVHRFDFHYPKRSVVELLKVPAAAASVLRLYSFFSELKPDIVHVICPSSAALYVVLLRQLFTFNTIVTFQGELFMDQDGIYDKSALMRFGLKQLLGITDSVTACSQYVLDDAKRKYDLTDKPCSVIFNGVNLGESPHIDGKSVNSGRPFVFALGRLVKNKGFDILIEAFSTLALERVDVDLLIAGSGSEAEALQNQIDSTAFRDRIRLVGRKDRTEVAGYFAEASLFVMPSPIEPFGIVCLEAMRAGKAIIATKSGGPPEFIEEGVDGLLVKPNSAADLANAMLTLLRDRELCQAMGQSTRRKVERFSWLEISRQYEDLYEQLIKTGTAAPERHYSTP